MKKIKLLLVMTGGLFRDGITLSQLEYMKRINKNQFDIDVLSSKDNTDSILEEFSKNNCNIIYISDRKKHLLFYIKELNKLMKHKKYDIIHVHGSSSLMTIELFLGKKNKIPVRIAHSRNTKNDHQILDRLLRSTFNKSYNCALACGKEAGDFLFQNNYFEVFHNGKDLDLFKFNKDLRKRVRKEYHMDDKMIFGTVGSLNEQKNINFAIELFSEYYKKNNNSLLFIVGEGHKLEELKELARKLNVEKEVVFTGKIHNINDILQGMDIMLLPSYFEGLPNVVLEWEASGLPCIISNTITTECKVYDEVYFLPINDTKKWINCINSIEEKKIDRTLLSNEGCSKLKENGFEINSNTRKLEKKYLELLNSMKNN